jgi:geranylgeranyl pyrophosphate synthase
MTSRSNAVPLSAYEDSLQRYLHGIAGRFDSVAGAIIAQRLRTGRARASMRPALQLWSAAANDGALDDALPIAASFDLFDEFMLLHDELADPGAAAIERWGLGQSLNAGDALYALAFRMLAGDVSQPSRRLAAARLVGEAVLAALDGSDRVPAPRSGLTGAAMKAGAVIAGAQARVAEAFANAGAAFEAAAQADDAMAAQMFATEAIELLRPHTRAKDLEAFEEAAAYVARRAV